MVVVIMYEGLILKAKIQGRFLYREVMPMTGKGIKEHRYRTAKG